MKERVSHRNDFQMKKNLKSDHECLLICWAAHLCMIEDLASNNKNIEVNVEIRKFFQSW